MPAAAATNKAWFRSHATVPCPPLSTGYKKGQGAASDMGHAVPFVLGLIDPQRAGDARIRLLRSRLPLAFRFLLLEDVLRE